MNGSQSVVVAERKAAERKITGRHGRVAAQAVRVALGDVSVPVLDIALPGRRVLSVPTQVGCPVRCRFCISSKQPYRRSLTAAEILALIGQAAPGNDGRDVLLSFSGEGDCALNADAVAETVAALPERWPGITELRYVTSGIQSRNIDRLPSDVLPSALQISLHSPVEASRRRLMPHADPLDLMTAVLRRNAKRFTIVRCNYVLMAGINDSDDDLARLIDYGDPDWIFLFNPLLDDRDFTPSPRLDVFLDGLKAAGRRVEVFSAIGAAMRGAVYEELTYQTVPSSPA